MSGLCVCQNRHRIASGHLLWRVPAKGIVDFRPDCDGTIAHPGAQFLCRSDSRNAHGGVILNIQDLSSDIKAGKISELNLVSMEGGSYVLHALMEGKSVPVQDSHGKPLHLASVEEARKVLSSVPDVRLFLSQDVVYDEMVGQDHIQGESSRHEIPLRSSL